MDADFFKAAGPNLKIVANYAVGFDNVDLAAAKKAGVTVTNTPSDKVSEAVAEHTFALMLTLARRISEADAYAKAKKYQGWDPSLLLGADVYGKTLGIVGAGRIGSAVARRAVTGFGMKLAYSDMRKNEQLEKDFGAAHLSFEKLLETSDFVSLHVPLLPATRHLISTSEFSLMKKTAFLVNTARGPVVDEKALLRALKTKRIAGAGIDVFECEPAIDCDMTDNLELKVSRTSSSRPTSRARPWSAAGHGESRGGEYKCGALPQVAASILPEMTNDDGLREYVTPETKERIHIFA